MHLFIFLVLLKVFNSQHSIYSKHFLKHKEEYNFPINTLSVHTMLLCIVTQYFSLCMHMYICEYKCKLMQCLYYIFSFILKVNEVCLIVVSVRVSITVMKHRDQNQVG